MPMDLSLYPADWRALSARIRFERAGGRCECLGECKSEHARPEHPWSAPAGYVYGEARCAKTHLSVLTNARTGRSSRVILTVAHLCACEPLCGDETHLKAMCQGCHLLLDVELHQRHARETRAKRRAASNHDLFEVRA